MTAFLPIVRKRSVTGAGLDKTAHQTHRRTTLCSTNQSHTLVALSPTTRHVASIFIADNRTHERRWAPKRERVKHLTSRQHPRVRRSHDAGSPHVSLQKKRAREIPTTPTNTTLKTATGESRKLGECKLLGQPRLGGITDLLPTLRANLASGLPDIMDRPQWARLGKLSSASSLPPVAKKQRLCRAVLDGGKARVDIPATAHVEPSNNLVHLGTEDLHGLHCITTAPLAVSNFCI